MLLLLGGCMCSNIAAMEAPLVAARHVLSLELQSAADAVMAVASSRLSKYIVDV